MTEEKTKKRFSSKEIIAVVAGIAIAILLVLLFLNNGNTTTTSKGTDIKVATSLICTASGIDNGVFDTYGAISSEYQIDAIFYDDKLDNLTYTYKGTYDDAATAQTAKGNIMAAFGLRLQKLGQREDVFSSKTPSLDDNIFRYLVHATRDQITPDTAVMLMIDVDKESSSQHVPDSFSELKSNYQNHGFLCKAGD